MAAQLSESNLTAVLDAVGDDVESRMRFLQTLATSRIWLLTNLQWDGNGRPPQGMQPAFVSDGPNLQQGMLAAFTDRIHAERYAAGAANGSSFVHPLEAGTAWAFLGLPAEMGVMINPNSQKAFRIPPDIAAELRRSLKRAIDAKPPTAPADAPTKQVPAGNYEPQLLKIQNAIEIGDIETAEAGIEDLIAAGAPREYVLSSKALVAKYRSDYAGALALFEEALKLTSDRSLAGEFWWLAAHTHKEAKDIASAEQAFRNAMDCEPGNSSYVVDLARLYSDERETEKAITVLKDAVKRDPSDPGPAIFMGNVLMEANRHEEGLAAIDAAIAQHPTAAGAHFNRGICLQMLGRIGEAQQAYEKALTLDPSLDGHQQYVNLRKMADGPVPASDIYLKLLLRRAGDDMPVSSRIDSHFALAKIYDSAGDSDRAFDHLHKANALKRSTMRWSLEEARAEFAKIWKLFDPAFIERCRGLAPSDMDPIFILGMPRSGTTLMEQILAAHSHVNAGGEMTHLAAAADVFLKKWAERSAIAADQDAELAADLQAIVQSFDARTKRLQAPGKRITDKMPGNFLHLGFIYLLFPKASVIHCQRNAVDTCLSCYERLFSKGLGFSYDFGDLAGYYHLYLKTMQHWRQVLPEQFILDMRYEEMVADQETQVRRALQFCGLEFEEGCMNFHEVKRAVTTASSLQVRQPLYKSSVNRWRKYGDRLAPLFEALGPEVTGPID